VLPIREKEELSLAKLRRDREALMKVKSSTDTDAARRE